MKRDLALLGRLDRELSQLRDQAWDVQRLAHNFRAFNKGGVELGSAIHALEDTILNLAGLFAALDAPDLEPPAPRPEPAPEVHPVEEAKRAKEWRAKNVPPAEEKGRRKRAG